MSESKIITPLLKGLIIDEPTSNSYGVRCCPATDGETEEKYIVKIISAPASQTQMDALLLSGAYPDAESALTYFKQVAQNTLQEAQLLQRLSQLDGFMNLEGFDLVEREDKSGYDLFLLSKHRTTLEQHFTQCPTTSMEAVNLGLDLCAALSICRQSGYLYVALKPENIYLSEQCGYQIGDLGFISLDALSYTSLPEKYRTPYTAPEIQDAFSTLNQTLDVYSVGMILYQIYNGGQLPAEGTELAAPAYADEALSAIILKACHEDPAQRWQTPEEMGLAIAAYMQNNGAENVPIAPLPEPEETAPIAEEAAEEELPEEAVAEEAENVEEAPQEIDDTEVTEDISEILEQADELIEHETPDPVIVPDPVNVEELLFAEEETPETEEPAGEETEQAAEEVQISEPVKTKKKGALRAVIGILIAILILLGLLGGGYYYYENYYIQTVNGITLTGEEDWLTVKLDTDIDNALLTVICQDTFGNTYKQSVVDNTARFEDLNPDTHYQIKVEISGFHKLVGTTSDSYNAPKSVNISGMTIANYERDGSVLLGFYVSGTNDYRWKVTYSTAAGESKSKEFTGDNVILDGLMLGNEYTFTLSTVTDEYVTGVDSIKFIPSNIIVAQKLQAVSFTNGTLRVQWETPEGSDSVRWYLTCFNDNLTKTVMTSDNSAVFEGLDPDEEYTVKITAANMIDSAAIRITAGAINLSNFTATIIDNGQLQLNWEPLILDGASVTEGWSIQYTIDNGPVQTLQCQNNSAVVPLIAPGSEYHFMLTHSSGVSVLGGELYYVTANSPELNLLQITKDDLEFKMCRRPNKNGWHWTDITEDNYTTEFTPGENASFVVHLRKAPAAYNDRIGFLFVVRDQNGGVVSVDSYTRNWNVMWYNYYGELNLPVMPSTPGEYTAQIYFEGGWAADVAFTVK